MKNFLQPANSSENTGLPQFFSNIFWQLYFKNINFLTKTKKCLLCWLLWIQNYQMTGKYLTSNTTFSKKSKSYEISNTGIYIGEDLEFIIHVFYWCIPLDHEIYTKCKKTSNLIKGISSHKICSEIKSQQVKKPFSTKNFWFFSKLLCSISSIYFRPFNFMCAFNR